MAVANPYLQKEWDEWKRGMEGSRRTRWTERVNRWTDYEVSETDDIEEESEDEADNIESETMEERKNEMKDEEHDEEGEGILERFQHYEKRDEEEDMENMETDERDGERDVMDSEEKVKKAGGVKDGEEYLGDDDEQEEEDEEDEGENGINREAEGDSQKEEGNHVHEDDNEEEEHQTEEPNRSYDQEEDFSGKINGIQVENIEPNQESRAQEDVKHEEDHRFSDTAEASSTQDSNEDEDGSDLLSNDEEPDTERGPAQEEFQCDHEKNQEDCTDDEKAQSSGAEDEDYDDGGKVYINEDYPTNVFLTLNEFRDSSLLTDLTLNTDDGRSFCVHSVVLAAVSSHIRKDLCRSKAENSRTSEGTSPDTADGERGWSVSLGPEVDHVGLQAIVEFAYTGNISCLNEDKTDQIKVAAEALGANRVLDLCAKEEELHTNSAAHKIKEGISAAKQMMTSLQSIKQLWMERAGCDVILKALGASLHGKYLTMFLFLTGRPTSHLDRSRAWTHG